MKVLLPIEDSEYSFQTIQWACQFFKGNDKTQLKFYVLHVIPLYTFHEDIMQPMIKEYETKESFRVLDEARQLLKTNGYHVEDSYYVIGDPAAEICKYADEKEIDHIIMASHARKGIGKLLMGSVSQEVFQKAKQSVIVLNNSKEKPSLQVNHLDDIRVTENV